MGWTDDLSVRLGRGVSMRDLVLYLRAARAEQTPRRAVLAVLTERFALPYDDARRAMDRECGGIVRSGNPANEPDPVKDPIAWASYRIELGLPVGDDAVRPSAAETAAAEELLDIARRAEPTKGTTDVAVALEVARLAVASDETGRTRFNLLLEAATAVSMASEACIARLGDRPCAPEGSQEWIDGVALATAARRITANFADPEFEQRGLGMTGRIVTRLHGQCHAFVGRVMLDSARCYRRNGNADRAATQCEAVAADFTRLLDGFGTDDPFDEYTIAFEYLLAAIDLLTELRGGNATLEALRARTDEVLSRSSTD